MVRAIDFVMLAPSLALDNGLGLTPQMGYSSWNDCGSTVNETWIKQTTRYFLDSGLAGLGYDHINVDEGWMLGRDPTSLLPVEDPALFPSGMRGLGEWIHAQQIPGQPGRRLRYGLYTSRGNTQCTRPEYRQRCLHGGPNPPACPGPHPEGWCGCEGSQGYEATDGEWMINAGADYIKEDSCSGSQNHSEAFADYARMRDVLNASGRPVFFSLCGWEPWYAPPDASRSYGGGASLGNSWRISGDGQDWPALSKAVNIMANLTAYHGPGGWNDPDLLLGPWCGIDHDQDFCGQTDLQARTQFTLWSLFPAPLLISQNVLAWSDYALETYSNAEAVAINQEPRSRAAVRLAGGELSLPCDDTRDSSCVNVWGRALRNGSLAVAMVNNAEGDREVTCDAECLRGMGVTLASHYRIRDLWAHAEIGHLNASQTLCLNVPAHGGHRYVLLVPYGPESELVV